MNRHSYADGCSCPACHRDYQQRTLWIGAVWTVLCGVGLVFALECLRQLITGSVQ